jgi:hypothetical protein
MGSGYFFAPYVPLHSTPVVSANSTIIGAILLGPKKFKQDSFSGRTFKVIDIVGVKDYEVSDIQVPGTEALFLINVATRSAEYSIPIIVNIMTDGRRWWGLARTDPHAPNCNNLYRKVKLSIADRDTIRDRIKEWLDKQNL